MVSYFGVLSAESEHLVSRRERRESKTGVRNILLILFIYLSYDRFC